MWLPCLWWQGCYWSACQLLSQLQGSRARVGAPVLGGVGRERREHLRAAGGCWHWQKPRKVWVGGFHLFIGLLNRQIYQMISNLLSFVNANYWCSFMVKIAIYACAEKGFLAYPCEEWCQFHLSNSLSFLPCPGLFRCGKSLMTAGLLGLEGKKWVFCLKKERKKQWWFILALHAQRGTRYKQDVC